MNRSDLTINFGEWLPDLPFYQNAGLVEAKNAIPVDKAYKDYITLSTSGDALTTTAMGAFAAINTAGDSFIYAGEASRLLVRNGTAWTTLNAAATTYNTASDGYWRFTQFDNLIIATNYADTIQAMTVGGATMGPLGVLGTAPRARQIAVINRFVMAGDTDIVGGTTPHRVQWSGINTPTNWPTPNTVTARALQAGEQVLPAILGPVTAIGTGEFAAPIFQARGIHRFTYIGGDVVWQVNTYETTRGCWFPQSMAQVGNFYYFIAADGFYVTDGNIVTAIGNAKVDKFFLADCDQTYRERVTFAIDYVNKCVVWSYPNFSATNGQPNQLIIYNWAESRWAHAEDTMQLLFSSLAQGYTLDQLDALYTSIDVIPLSFDSAVWQGGANTMMAFGTDKKLGTFSGSSAAARFETGEADLNPFGRVFIRGVRPRVTGGPTNVTVTIGVRNNQDNEGRSFGTATQRTTRTGVCDFRTMARFASLRCDITGGFDRALGLDIDGEEGDQV